MLNRGRNLRATAAAFTAMAFLALLIGQKPSWGMPMFCVFALAGAGLLVVSLLVSARDLNREVSGEPQATPDSDELCSLDKGV